MEYLLKVRNPKSGKIEIYSTSIKTQDDIPLVLDFWRNAAGYEIISFEPTNEGVA